MIVLTLAHPNWWSQYALDPQSWPPVQCSSTSGRGEVMQVMSEAMEPLRNGTDRKVLWERVARIATP
jgi:hypothetical protein